MKTKHVVTGIILSLLFLSARGQDAKISTLAWKDSPGDILNQFPGWYNTTEALDIADNVLHWQRDNGGWPANKDMVQLSDIERKSARKNRKADDSNFDNGATYTQLQFLAMVHELNGQPKYRKAFLEGLDYVLEAQYDNGGWPLYYPNFTDYNEENSDYNPEGYTRYITFKNNVMVGVMTLLQDIANRHARYAFVDEDRRQKSAQALGKGIECTLKTQMKSEDKLAGWCAQYDDKTLEPRWGRHFEPPVLSSHETAGVVQFLMKIDESSPEIINAIQSAVKWMNEVKIRDAMVLESSGEEVTVPEDEKSYAWAHFYDMDRGEPVFANDGMTYDTYAALPHEIQDKYQWYSTLPYKVLTTEYARWQKQWAVKNVLIRQ